MIEALLQAERLLVHGMVDQAERIFSSTLEHDPHNSIAVVGLARVALERGDDELAYERTRQALAIDPENLAARRLEARLEEVLGRRGAEAGRQPLQDERGETPPASRPSERFVFERNPSMADHRAAEERRDDRGAGR